MENRVNCENSVCYLYAGPSLAPLRAKNVALPGDICVLPPVQRGDVPRLIAENPPATLAIADGNFHHCLAVGHVELRNAMALGWQVWGLSSMGAIRACEMRVLGVRGFGRIYEQFVTDPELPDDVVALLHGPAPDYVSFTEPMLHLEEALRSLVMQQLLAPEASSAISLDLRSRWYGERTLTAFRDRLMQNGVPAIIADALITDFDSVRLKSADLAAFLAAAPWRNPNRSEKSSSKRL